MKKCLLFILALICLTAVIVSCTNDNNKDNGPGTIVVPVTDEQGETVTDTNGEIVTEIKPAPDTEEITTKKKFNIGDVDTSDGWGPLTPVN